MTLLKALMNQGHTKEEALELINDMRDAVLQGSDPEEELWAQGLEPDYIFELLEP